MSGEQLQLKSVCLFKWVFWDLLNACPQAFLNVSNTQSTRQPSSDRCTNYTIRTLPIFEMKSNQTEMYSKGKEEGIFQLVSLSWCFAIEIVCIKEIVQPCKVHNAIYYKRIGYYLLKKNCLFYFSYILVTFTRHLLLDRFCPIQEAL